MALVNSGKIALADTFAFYLKAHNYHWNIEGPNFNDYHAFLNVLYNDAWTATDLIAEHLRTLDTYVPGSFERFKELATIEDETKVPNAKTMLTRLESDNKKVIASLTNACNDAEAEKKLGFANFLQDRIDIHEKNGWMLRAMTK